MKRPPTRSVAQPPALLSGSPWSPHGVRSFLLCSEDAAHPAALRSPGRLCCRVQGRTWLLPPRCVGHRVRLLECGHHLVFLTALGRL
ncbi:hypothetical protein NDU88_000669 [Pleurodeles waltl]|uniref:Uncharacterized protein n=1 Tax=Pleurodeles waltl TaxID=8319 RepID=A0AAV7NC14_PLEWA|nr:hypothetical protein NDU88_000669 [Pleurodeles waltl]